jgi:hypothetical protein
MPDLNGQTLGHYRIVEQIGAVGLEFVISDRQSQSLNRG